METTGTAAGMGQAVAERHTGENYILLRAGARPGRRIGIYSKGGCDLKVLLACAPLIRRVLNGTCCIINEGVVADSRSDILLQTLREYPRTPLERVAERLRLGDEYFRPRLFEPTFAVPGADGRVEEFPKTVVALGIGSDVVRTVYRHRKHGLLVDPGGGWLNQSLEPILNDPSVLTWFREQYECIGRIDVRQFAENFAAIIGLIRERTGARILVFNYLTIDPGSVAHNYQFIRNCHAMRRREFNLALVELSRALDFAVVDVDRILKRAGIRSQVDFGHPPASFNPIIAREAFRILEGWGIF